MKSLDFLYYLKRRRRRKILNEPEIGKNDGALPLYHPITDNKNKEIKQTFFEMDKNFKIKEVKKQKKQKKVLLKFNFSLANSFNIGYYLITPLVIGVFFGLLVDNFFKSRPIFTLIFLLLGSLGTFYNLWKTVKES